MLQALQNFFAALVYSANTSFDSLLESLLACAKPSPQSGGIAKQALHSIAQCVAVLCLAAGDQKCSSTVKMLTDILKDDSSSNSVSFFLQYFCRVVNLIDNPSVFNYLCSYSLIQSILQFIGVGWQSVLYCCFLFLFKWLCSVRISS